MPLAALDLTFNDAGVRELLLGNQERIVDPFELLLSERVVLDGLQERAAGIEIHPGSGKCKASAYPGALNVNHDFAPVEAALTLGG